MIAIEQILMDLQIRRRAAIFPHCPLTTFRAHKYLVLLFLFTTLSDSKKIVKEHLLPRRGAHIYFLKALGMKEILAAIRLELVVLRRVTASLMLEEETFSAVLSQPENGRPWGLEEHLGYLSGFESHRRIQTC